MSVMLMVSRQRYANTCFFQIVITSLQLLNLLLVYVKTT